MAANGENSEVKLRSHMITDVGMVRDHNEDCAYVDTGADFFVVADGMGGHAAGEVASAMAVATVREALETARTTIENFASSPSDDGRKELVTVLESAVRQAHQAVYDRGANETDKQGMGTTLDVVMLAGPEAFVAHVGDSRTYLVRDGKAAQITTDHTVAEVLVIEGKLSLEEAQISPLRTILVNAIGVAPDVGVEMAHVRLRTGDQLLLCSDGLHDYFPLEQELADHLTGANPEKALAEMVDIAKNRGGHDNITGVVVEILDAPAEPASATAAEERAAGLESTQQMPAMSDGVPAEVATEDTVPVDDPDAPSGLEDTLRPREADEETLEAPAFTDEATTADESPAAVTEASGDDDEDMTATVRLKPLDTKKAKAKEKAQVKKPAAKKAKKAGKKSSARDAKASSKDGSKAAKKSGKDDTKKATKKSNKGDAKKSDKPKKKKKRRRSKKAATDDISRADTMPPKPSDDSDDTTADAK